MKKRPYRLIPGEKVFIGGAIGTVLTIGGVLHSNSGCIPDSSYGPIRVTFNMSQDHDVELFGNFPSPGITTGTIQWALMIVSDGHSVYNPNAKTLIRTVGEILPYLELEEFEYGWTIFPPVSNQEHLGPNILSDGIKDGYEHFKLAPGTKLWALIHHLMGDTVYADIPDTELIKITDNMVPALLTAGESHCPFTLEGKDEATRN